MNLSDLEQYNPITIQCHDNPDADTISAGYALYCYFKSKHKRVRLIYSGQNKIQKKNLCLMKEKLNIPIKYVRYARDEVIKGLLITVDCQYGSGNVSRIPERIMNWSFHAYSLIWAAVQPWFGVCSWRKSIRSMRT